ncbi:hypothetical protein SprV_0301081100 [Sparganum proliferum]
MLQVRQLHHVSAASIKEFCKKIMHEFAKLNILVLHSVYMSKTFDKTVDGLERHRGLNFVSSYLLSENLLPLLRRSSSQEFTSRLVFVSSRLHKFGALPDRGLTEPVPEHRSFDWWAAYTSSHLMIVTYANYLKDHEPQSKVAVAVIHPGLETGLINKAFWKMFETTAFCRFPFLVSATTLKLHRQANGRVADASAEHLLADSFRCSIVTFKGKAPPLPFIASRRWAACKFSHLVVVTYANYLKDHEPQSKAAVAVVHPGLEIFWKLSEALTFAPNLLHFLMKH